MASEHEVASEVARATSLMDLGLRACEAYGRPDLAARLQAARRRLTDPAVHVVVVGEFKQGKSSLVNALVGAEVCPVDDDVATAVPTFVRYGDEPRTQLLFDGREPTVIAPDDVPSWATERDPARAVAEVATDDGQRPAGVDLRVPSRLLAGGQSCCRLDGRRRGLRHRCVPGADPERARRPPEGTRPHHHGGLRPDQDRLLPGVARHRGKEPLPPHGPGRAIGARLVEPSRARP